MARIVALLVFVATACAGGSTHPADLPDVPDLPDLPATDTPPADTADTPSPDTPTLFPADRVMTVVVDLTPDRWQAITSNPEAEEYQQADLTFDGTRVEGVAIRTKGNSSLNHLKQTGSHRYSFKVDINEYTPDLTLRGEKKFVLNNGFKDPTLIREHLAYGLVADAGLPAPRTAFVDLTVAGEHLGLYTLVEAVDGGFYDDWFDDGNGDAYKPEPPAGFLQYLGDDPTKYEGLEPERNEDTTDHAAFLALVKALDGTDSAAYSQVLDLDAVARYLAVNVLLVNLDSYLGMGHNYYLFEEDGVFTLIPWDLNEAFGNFTCQCDRTGLIHLRIDDPTCDAAAARPLVAKLLAVASFRETYHKHLRTLLDGPFSPAMMQARIDTAAALIRPYVEKDTTKFFTSGEFEQGLATDVSGKSGSAIGLAAFVSERGAAVKAQLDGSEPASNGGKGSCGNTTAKKCGDGICDAAEKADPKLCPKDCK